VKIRMATDGEMLIRRIAAGDREAFARFYDRYAPLALSLVTRIVHARADAADVLQEVFWEAWQAAATYDAARGTPEAWILNRARSRAIDRVRSLRRRSETFVAPLPEASRGPEASAPDAGQRAADRNMVMTGLERLPEPQREVIALAYYDGLTQTEIAARLGQPLGTIKTRMRLGMERLREVLVRAG
jgi:RNA polymerase sigma-70 factor (ECF subfamily)